MKYIINNGKKNDSETLQTFFDYSNKVIDDLIYPEFLGEYLELQIVLSKKINVSPKDYHNKLAEFHISNSDKQKETFIVHDFYLKAL